MSDEPLPTPEPRADDEVELPEPDEHGYGHYVVEEYSGGPLPDRDRMSPAVDDDSEPFERFDAPTDPFDDLDDLDERSPDPVVDRMAALPPPVRPLVAADSPVDNDRRLAVSDHHDDRRDHHDHPDHHDLDDPAPIRPARVPWAERNWRLPVIGVLAATIVVLIAAVLLLPDGGIEQRETLDVVELRDLPVKGWDEDLDGFGSGVISTEESIYVVVAKAGRTEVVAFDIDSGDEQWATPLGDGAGNGDLVGDIAIIDDEIAVVLGIGSAGSATDGTGSSSGDDRPGGTRGSGSVTGESSPPTTVDSVTDETIGGATSDGATSDGATSDEASGGAGTAGAGEQTVFAVLVRETGAIRWQAPVPVAASTVVSGAFIRSVDGSGVTLRRIDRDGKALGDPVAADATFVVGDDVYLDVDDTLQRASIGELELDDDFRFDHRSSVASVVAFGDEVVVAVGEEIVRLDDRGAERYRFDPGLGIVRALMPMRGDVVLASGSARMRVVAIDDGSATATTPVRSGVQPLRVIDVDDEELILAFAGPERGPSDASIRIERVVDDVFEEVGDIGVTTLDGIPPITVAGSTLYTVSYGTATRLIAVDPSDGRRLWSLPLATGDVPALGPSSVVVLSREDDESVLSVFAAAG